VKAWWSAHSGASFFLSVLVLAEIRRGIESKRPRDALQAKRIDHWLKTITTYYAERIIPIDRRIADVYGRLQAVRTFPVTDGLMAATALATGLTVVTRNLRDFRRAGVAVVNPFA